MIEVRELSATEVQSYVPALAGVLLDCVEGGASVSFMSSLTRAEAEGFFAKLVRDVHCGERMLFAAFLDGELIGTVQVVTAMPPNQPHRADVSKMLVKRSARNAESDRS